MKCTIPRDHELIYCKDAYTDGCMYIVHGYDNERFAVFVPYYKDCVVVFFNQRQHEIDCCELSVFDYKTFVENELLMVEYAEIDKKIKFMIKDMLENQLSLTEILCDITQAQIMKNAQILEAKFRQKTL